VVVRFWLGDLLTGRRIQAVPAVSGTWSEVLNGPGTISVTTTLKDPAVRLLDLPNTATAGKTFLAAVDGDLVLQAGPVIEHDWSDPGEMLTIRAEGLWSYYNKRVILPYTETSPADPATDTNLTKSYQGMVRYYVEQSQGWPNGDLPVILPDEEPGDYVRNEPGSNLAPVGERIRQLNGIEGGPDVQFQPRWNADRDGFEWVLRIGTPAQPLLFSTQEVVFNASVAESSISNLRVRTSGVQVATRVYTSGGRSSDKTLIGVAENAALLEQGFPALDRVDASYSTVELQETMDSHAVELAAASARPRQEVTFDHQVSARPFLSSFTVGDFAELRVSDHPYLGDDNLRMRIQSRSGDAVGEKVSITLQPEVDQ
jgi:hypothetical protein